MDNSQSRTLTDEQFKKCLDRLRRELNTANWHFQIYQILKNKKAEYQHEINQAAPFWALTINSHALLTFIILNRFFDKNDRHLSLRSLIDAAEHNLDIFSVEQFKDRLRKSGRYDDHVMKHYTPVTAKDIQLQRQTMANLPVSELRNWRNKLLAHIDKDWVIQGKDLKSLQINTSHVLEIIESFDKILNYYHGAYDASVWIKDIPLKNEIENVLDSIKMGLIEKRYQYGLD
jgi:hypothetical protein